MGDAGGDNDWYGYCLDDPVNSVDPLGLVGLLAIGTVGLTALGRFAMSFPSVARVVTQYGPAIAESLEQSALGYPGIDQIMSSPMDRYRDAKKKGAELRAAKQRKEEEEKKRQEAFEKRAQERAKRQAEEAVAKREADFQNKARERAKEFERRAEKAFLTQILALANKSELKNRIIAVVFGEKRPILKTWKQRGIAVAVITVAFTIVELLTMEAGDSIILECLGGLSPGLLIAYGIYTWDDHRKSDYSNEGDSPR